MKRIKEKFENALLRGKLAINRFVTEERGDTNFLSIAIVLVVVLALAVVFIGFGDKVTTWVNNAIADLERALG